MRAVDSRELLDIWENCRPLGPLDFSLRLLAALYRSDVQTVSMLSIGDRDARLLLFRERAFGGQLRNVAHCPACNGKVEWEMQTAQMRLQAPTAEIAAPLQWEYQNYRIHFRLPTSRDILEAQNEDESRAEMLILKNCIQSAVLEEQDIEPARLPPEALEGISSLMAERDPQADVRIALECPDCNQSWTASFDIMSYLWTEIDTWARRLISEIAALARVFGWSEGEILKLSPARRAMYLDLVISR